jgi:hypothetical protein
MEKKSPIVGDVLRFLVEEGEDFLPNSQVEKRHSNRTPFLE